MAKTTSFVLGEHFEDLLRRKVASGRYSNASEVLREALRLMENRDKRREALERALSEGEGSGELLSHDEVWSEVEARHPWVK